MAAACGCCCWLLLTSAAFAAAAAGVQANQVKGLYVEDSDIFGSAGNGVALDGVAVQYGYVCRSNIHHADWCMYLKGEAQMLRKMQPETDPGSLAPNTQHNATHLGQRVSLAST
jgi:hypothetical protein